MTASASGLRLAVFTDTFAPQVNGVARTLEHLVRTVEGRGGAVHVETVAMPGTLPAERVRRAPSLPFWAYPELRIAAPSSGAAERRLARFAPTVVHVATPFGVGLAGRAAARRRRLPLVSSYHTTFPEYLRHYGLTALDQLAWPFLRWFHNAGLRTFVPSETVRRELTRQGFHGLRIWSRGVDAVRFAPTHRTTAMRRAMGAGDDEFVVASVGRLAPEKRIDDVLTAVRMLQRRFGRRIRLAIAGDGPERERLRATAPEGTWFAGTLSGTALAEFFASADAFAFASDTETFGNVVLEAMASGLPVVAPDAGATLEFAHPGNALTFPARAADQLAGQLARLLLDPALRTSLTRLGRAEAESRSWDAVWDRLVADYRDVSQPHPTGATYAA